MALWSGMASRCELSLASDDDRDPHRRRANQEPPPMLSLGQWEAAAEIGGAHNIKELGKQFVLAVEVDAQLELYCNSCLRRACMCACAWP